MKHNLDQEQTNGRRPRDGWTAGSPRFFQGATRTGMRGQVFRLHTLRTSPSSRPVQSLLTGPSFKLGAPHSRALGAFLRPQSQKCPSRAAHSLLLFLIPSAASGPCDCVRPPGGSGMASTRVLLPSEGPHHRLRCGHLGTVTPLTS